MPILKIDHKNTKCCKCGNNKTRIKWLDLEGKEVPDWRRHRCNRKDCTSYVCYDCYIVGPKKSREYFLEKTTGRKCRKCGNDKTYVNNSGTHHWFKYIDEEGIWDGKSYLCQRCHSIIKNNLPDSGANIIKSMRKSRTGQLTICSETGKGLIGEAVIAKIRDLDILSIKLNNLNCIFDLSIDCTYGRIQVKLRNPYYGYWHIRLDRDHNFDTLFILCLNEHMKKVDRMYIIPESELYNVMGINICMNPTKQIGSRYDRFRVDSGPYDYIYQDLMSYLRNKISFGIEEIKEWLNTKEKK